MRAPVTFSRVVVIGGGCYGSWYTQQLSRAQARGALRVGEIVVVDRDPRCVVAQRIAEGAYGDAPVQFAVRLWRDYLAEWLAKGVEGVADDAMVPSPLMPHLCLDWLMDRARARWPSRSVEVAPLAAPPPMPWERAAPDGRHYVSYATWMCPVNCIEPATCPETRGPRDWSMPPALERYVSGQSGVLDAALIFHCVHRTYGVGMIDASQIAGADAWMASRPPDVPIRALVGTVSHCHGALGVLAVT
jgi:hypothetical protein